MLLFGIFSFFIIGNFSVAAAEDLSPELQQALDIHEGVEDVRVYERGFQGNLIRWAKNFNFIRWGLSMYRASSLHDEDNVREATHDVLFLMMFSHPLEMASAPIFISVGSSYNWPNWLIAGLGSGGGIISIPGLDPLCLILVGSYFKLAPWRAIVSSTRQLVWEGGRRVSSGLQMRRLMDWASYELGLQKESRVSAYLLKAQSFYPDSWLAVSQEGSVLELNYFSPDFHPLMKLKIQNEDSREWVDEISLYEAPPEYQVLKLQMLNGLGINLKLAVRDLTNDLQNYGRHDFEWPFYVREAQEVEGGISLKLKAGAFPIRKILKYEKYLLALKYVCQRQR